MHTNTGKQRSYALTVKLEAVEYTTKTS